MISEFLPSTGRNLFPGFACFDNVGFSGSAIVRSGGARGTRDFGRRATGRGFGGGPPIIYKSPFSICSYSEVAMAPPEFRGEKGGASRQAQQRLPGECGLSRLKTPPPIPSRKSAMELHLIASTPLDSSPCESTRPAYTTLPPPPDDGIDIPSRDRLSARHGTFPAWHWKSTLRSGRCHRNRAAI